MALTLMFAQQMLIATARDGLARITVDTKKTVDVESFAVPIRASRAGQRQGVRGRTSKLQFAVRFGNLPGPAQHWYRKQVSIAYERLVAETPKQEIVRGTGYIPTKTINGRVVRVRLPIRYREVPTPKKPEITSDTRISVVTSHQYNGYPALKVDKELVIRIENKNVDFSHRTFVVGKITSFTIITPAPR